MNIKNNLKRIMPFVDVLISPIVLVLSFIFKMIRRIGIERFKVCKKIFCVVGVFPIRKHYYEPLFDGSELRYSLNKDRKLPGINLNIKKQLSFLSGFNYECELLKLPIEKEYNEKFFYNNGAFESGDAEILYSIIRYFKPKKIIEIGSGNSTLMAIEAIRANENEDYEYKCKHICIEPYEMPWLEKTTAEIIREKVENVNIDLFMSLNENDILFIDSSHVIRPQGDVLFELLEILPVLNKGVLVHFHDIFTPKDYSENHIMNDVKMWNEQYLLEAFMCHNNKFEIVAALNYLIHNHHGEIIKKCPILKSQIGREPGSFWIRKIL